MDSQAVSGEGKVCVDTGCWDWHMYNEAQAIPDTPVNDT